MAPNDLNDLKFEHLAEKIKTLEEKVDTMKAKYDSHIAMVIWGMIGAAALIIWMPFRKFWDSLQ